MKRILCLFLPAFLCGAPAVATETVQAHDAWVREAPPTAQVLAGYMKLVNSGARAAAIVGARADGFARVELHETVLENGSAMMREVKTLPIPAGGELVLAPGGLHLMLMQPQRPFRAGDEIRIELKLQDGGTLRILAPVRAGHSPSPHRH